MNRINKTEKEHDFYIIELVIKSKLQCNHSFELLLNEYYPLILSIACNFFAYGSEKEDLIQEGCIGLLMAVRMFDTTKYTSFTPLAKICVRRRILQIVRSNNSKKQLIHHGSRSLFEDTIENTMLINEISINEMNPIDLIVEREKFKNFQNQIKQLLSKYERTVFILFINGLTYKEISEKLQCTEKSIDNALYRIRKKCTILINEDTII